MDEPKVKNISEHKLFQQSAPVQVYNGVLTMLFDKKKF